VHLGGRELEKMWPYEAGKWDFILFEAAPCGCSVYFEWLRLWSGPLCLKPYFGQLRKL